MSWDEANNKDQAGMSEILKGSQEQHIQTVFQFRYKSSPWVKGGHLQHNTTRNREPRSTMNTDLPGTSALKEQRSSRKQRKVRCHDQIIVLKITVWMSRI